MIAIVAGGVAALIGLLLVSKRSSKLRENDVQTPGGTQRIQERGDFNV
jgi:hypothetical protein